MIHFLILHVSIFIETIYFVWGLLSCGLVECAKIRNKVTKSLNDSLKQILPNNGQVEVNCDHLLIKKAANLQ